MNYNSENIKAEAAAYASRSFVPASAEWIDVYGSQLIRLTAKTCIDIDDKTHYYLSHGEVMCVASKIENYFNL